MKVLEKAEELVYLTYTKVKELPKEEKYIIIPQILRSAISVPSNIAEGQQRTDKEFIRFIGISRGILKELEVQINIIKKVYDLDCDNILNLIDEIGRMSYRLMLKLKSDAQNKNV